MTNVALPQLGEGVEKASITYWYKNIGDAVKEGEDIVELVTDKATFNMPAPASGKIKDILMKEGEEAKVGQVLAIIE